MLAELAIANAAFAVIKETVANGGDIMAAGKHLFSFFDSKAAIAKQANASGSDSEAFFALEAIKRNEQELQEIMIYYGRAALTRLTSPEQHGVFVNQQEAPSGSTNHRRHFQHRRQAD